MSAAGIDRQRFVSLTDDEYDEIKCGICLGVLNKPLVNQCCQQSYCDYCIHEWIKTSKTCPNCRKSLTVKKLFPAPRFSVNLIERLDIYCDFRDDGCLNVCKLSALNQHLNSCLFNPKNKCQYCEEQIFSASDHKCGPQLKELVDSLRTEVSELKTSNQKLRSITRKHKSRVEEMQKQFDEEMNHKNEEFETLSLVSQHMEQQVSALQREVTDLKTQNQNLCQQNQSFSGENQKLRQDMKDMRKHCDDYLNTRESLEKSNQSLTQELIELRQELDSIREQSVQLKADNESLKSSQFTNTKHMTDVIKSARDHIREPDIKRSKLSKMSQSLAISKITTAITTFDTYRDIAINLKKDIESYKRGVFWHTLVVSDTCSHLITYTNEDIIDIAFGELRVKLFSV
ncbi:E3 ubiquitin-protein ligase TRIM62-like [Oppia nitens]|uniref:E3 ubiquitin-protein ligase TRIM62-like n=1 Tax=Oppia nitens TaxID=1686743 RepID=UPI0023DAC5E2|nr:E3 ubiquitin-protein ligase TRIM62-like [Oppia nitens]